jgi:hypothetical protein
LKSFELINYAKCINYFIDAPALYLCSKNLALSSSLYFEETMLDKLVNIVQKDPVILQKLFSYFTHEGPNISYNPALSANFYKV